MIRVLQIVDSMGFGGIQAFIMNVYRNLDRKIIQFDFLLCHHYENSYENEILSMGGRIFFVASRRLGFLKNRNDLNGFFASHHSEYKIIHFHESSLSYITPLIYAKKYQIEKRIVHCHSSRIIGSFFHKLLHFLNKKRIHRFANVFLACGKLAGNWFYSGTKVINNYEVVYNGVNVSKFSFDPEERKNIREEMKLQDKYVVGHVGRFCEVKNHKFLIDVFFEILKKNKNSILLLIGEGPLKEQIQRDVTDKGINDKVLFLGNRQDVGSILQAMDIFIMPSLYEGFPISIIEASTSGLPVLMSDSITDEVLIKKNMKALSINLPPSEWANEALLLKERITNNDVLFEKGLSVDSNISKLLRLYLQ